MMPIRVLVTDAESRKALAAVRGLGRAFAVWTTSTSRVSLAAWSRFVAKHVVLRPKPSGFAEEILALCCNDKIDVVICPEERSSFLVAREARRFADKGIALATPPFHPLATAMDKASTIRRAQEAHIPVPRTKVLCDVSEALSAAEDIGYPVVVKPRHSHFWTGEDFLSAGDVRYARSDGELTAQLQDWPTGMPLPLLQEYVSGRGLGIFVVLDADGRVCAEFAHERIRDLRPTGCGSVLRRSIPADPELMDMSLRLLRSIGWCGAAMVEFRVPQQAGQPHLMEINGRLWGSLQLTIDAGINVPALLVELALGRPVHAPKHRTGVVSRWWLGDVVRTLTVFRGKPRGFPGPFPSRWSSLVELLGRQPPGTRNEILRWDDPWPGLGEVVSAIRHRL